MNRQFICVYAWAFLPSFRHMCEKKKINSKFLSWTHSKARWKKKSTTHIRLQTTDNSFNGYYHYFTVCKMSQSLKGFYVEKKKGSMIQFSLSHTWQWDDTKFWHFEYFANKHCSCDSELNTPAKYLRADQKWYKTEKKK